MYNSHWSATSFYSYAGMNGSDLPKLSFAFPFVSIGAILGHIARKDVGGKNWREFLLLRSVWSARKRRPRPQSIRTAIRMRILRHMKQEDDTGIASIWLGQSLRRSGMSVTWKLGNSLADSPANLPGSPWCQPICASLKPMDSARAVASAGPPNPLSSRQTCATWILW